MAEYQRLQTVNKGPGISAGAPALREEAATPSNASLALPGPMQAGMNGGFQFRAGQVGSQKVPACSCAYLATRHRPQSSRVLCALARLGAQSLVHEKHSAARMQCWNPWLQFCR